MEARPLPSRADEIAYINELRKAYRLDAQGRDAAPCYTGANLKPFRPKFVQGYAEWDNGQDDAQGRCIRFAPNPKPEGMKRYLESGFGLTDLYCQRYFISATETRQSRNLQRGLFKAGDALLNAVMAALDFGANPIAISNATFSAIDSGYGAVDDAFVVAPSREDVRKLVLSAQQKFRAQVFKEGELPDSYPSARSTIERYAGLCTFDGMRQLVADAVASKTDSLNKSAEETPKQKTGVSGNQKSESSITKPGKASKRGSVSSKKTPGAKSAEKAAKSPPSDSESLVVPPPISPTSETKPN